MLRFYTHGGAVTIRIRIYLRIKVHHAGTWGRSKGRQARMQCTGTVLSRLEDGSARGSLSLVACP